MRPSEIDQAPRAAREQKVPKLFVNIAKTIFLHDTLPGFPFILGTGRRTRKGCR